MKINIKNNKEGTLQGMRVLIIKRSHKEDNNGSSGEESAKTKKPRVEIKKHISEGYDLITIIYMGRQLPKKS